MRTGVFYGKTAIVTGGASGIGRALCMELARRGVQVTVADINGSAAEEVATSIRQEGGGAKANVLDVTSSEAVTVLVQSVAERHGRLDYMFNNAGIGIAAEARDIDMDCWRRFVDINLLGVLHGTAAAYAVMAQQGTGHIVNTASLAGLLPLPTSAPYSMTKHGIVGLTMALRFEGEALGVRFSVACPGFVKTQFYDSATVVKADRKKVFDMPASSMMSPEKAAVCILQGVARNKAVIAFPFSSRLAWRLYRWFPWALAPVGRKFVQAFRASRSENDV